MRTGSFSVNWKRTFLAIGWTTVPVVSGHSCITINQPPLCNPHHEDEKTWQEWLFRWGNIEFLCTGGLVGTCSGSPLQLDAFLGPSLRLKKTCTLLLCWHRHDRRSQPGHAIERLLSEQ